MKVPQAFQLRIIMTIPVLFVQRAASHGVDSFMSVADYNRIEKVIHKKVAAMEAKINKKFDECKENVNRYYKELLVVKQELEMLKATDCSDVKPEDFKNGNKTFGVFDIHVGGREIEAYCDLHTDNGGWTVIQRRMDGSIDFFRERKYYVEGFGNLNGEFWIGLENLHRIVVGKTFELRIDMEDWDGVRKFAKYTHFSVDGNSDDYKLIMSGYSGTAGDAMSGASGAKFTTKDHDVDNWSSNCAENFKGGWWFKTCHGAHLNGLYHEGGPHESYADGVDWSTWKGHYYSLKFAEMKIRPIIQ